MIPPMGVWLFAPSRATGGTLTMPRTSDVMYTEHLVQMVRADVDRSLAQPLSRVRRSVAIWMTHELDRQAASLRLTDLAAKDLHAEADRLRRKILDAMPLTRFANGLGKSTPRPMPELEAHSAGLVRAGGAVTTLRHA